MWNLSLGNILQFLVTFSTYEKILQKTTALYTHTSIHTDRHTPTQIKYNGQKIQATSFKYISVSFNSNDNYS